MNDKDILIECMYEKLELTLTNSNYNFLISNDIFVLGARQTGKTIMSITSAILEAILNENYNILIRTDSRRYVLEKIIAICIDLSINFSSGRDYIFFNDFKSFIWISTKRVRGKRFDMIIYDIFEISDSISEEIQSEIPYTQKNKILTNTNNINTQTFLNNESFETITIRR